MCVYNYIYIVYDWARRWCGLSCMYIYIYIDIPIYMYMYMGRENKYRYRFRYITFLLASLRV